MADLRGEIVETQKARADFIKWKLIICAGLGGAALGLNGSGGFLNAYVLLALLPPACVYCDAECYHFTLRIIVIGSYLKMDKEAAEHNYERFAALCGQAHSYRLEDIVLSMLTKATCAACAVFGAAILIGANPLLLLFLNATGESKAHEAPQVGLVFILSGVACYVVNRKVEQMFDTRRSDIECASEGFQFVDDPA